jgi:hypothetical protein
MQRGKTDEEECNSKASSGKTKSANRLVASRLIGAFTHNIQGRAKTQTEGRILKSTYQQIEATKKMAPMM